MKKIWFGIGAVVIIILLLLQTKFNIFLQLDNNGYAVEEKTVKTLLMSNPEDVIEDDVVPMCGFEPLEYIYKRANSYYLGEKKKTPIDLGFPLLINGGAGVWFIDDTSTLFDTRYDEYSTYFGLSVSERISYNPGGSRADAGEFLFAGLKNGFFVNFDSFTFDDAGTEREVPANSFIYFTKDYFTYCEQDGDQLRYQICRSMPQSAMLRVNNEDVTYHQLLLDLKIISDKPSRNNTELGPDPVVEAVPTPEILELGDTGDQKEELDTAEPTSAPEKPARPVSNRTKRASSGGGGNSKTASSANRGVRPDSARPDKQKDKKDPTKRIPDYKKPEVKITSKEAGTYRITIHVEVSDPSGVIDKYRRIQFEYYEQKEDGTEELVYRTYTASTNDVEAGDGNIKPNTTYRVNVYYTYDDEYGESVTESIDSNIILTTGKYEDLGTVKFKTGPVPNSSTQKFTDVPIYYDQYLEIVNVTPDESSDPEALYGIGPRNLVINIKGVSGAGASTDISVNVDPASVKTFKDAVEWAVFKTQPLLAPNSEYKYKITATDYFKKDIKLENNEGHFFTCKSRPQGSIEIIKNEFKDKTLTVNLGAKVIDPDAASIKPNATPGGDAVRHVYLAISTINNTEMAGTSEVWKEYEKNKYQVSDAIPYCQQISEYTVTADGKLEVDISKMSISGLALDTKYYAYLLADFDLQNNTDPIYHGQIGSTTFRSAGITTLGNLYVDVDITKVSAHGAVIFYTLNTANTNPELKEMLEHVSFDIVRANEKVVDSKIDFNETMMNTFLNGEDIEVGGERKTSYTIAMDGKYFDRSMHVNEDDPQFILNSKTDYTLVGTAQIKFNDKYYNVKVVPSRSAFKTYLEPATVDVQDLIFAAGTLKFKVKIDDPDDAITGNSGHMVVMSLYDYNRNLKKTVRIPKYKVGDEKEYQELMFAGLDPSQKYFMNFTAIEYNEGYTNDTFESNKVLARYDITESLDITGSIKLQRLSSDMFADIKVNIHDRDKIMTSGVPYYIKVEKDGTDISKEYDESLIKVTSYTHESDTEIVSNKTYKVDKGEHKYKFTLYIKYNNNDLVLDTLDFTTEREIVPINNAAEFVKMIKDNGANDVKYCITGDIDLTAYDANSANNPSGYENSNSIVNIFNGEIDFQGYKLIKDKTNDNTQIFNNIGPTGEIYNAVFEFRDNTSVRIHDEGALASRNYGHIHDVVVNYKGGSGAANQYYGLLCRINAASGVIERFVVNNDPEEGSSTFSARSNCGLVCSSNEGIVRNGYVYGSDINACVSNTSIGGDIYVGGIAGNQTNLGQMYNVFSLVNVVVSRPNMHSPIAEDTRYGAVIGSASGSAHNMYSIGQSMYNEAYNGKLWNADSYGPTLGLNLKNSHDVFYWNESNYTYNKSTYSRRISIESLYDYNWQGKLLGNQFTSQPVEVGFYPQLKMSDELPEQELIPLPSKTNSKLVDIVSSRLIDYDRDENGKLLRDENGKLVNSAVIEFRLTNFRNAAILGFEIEDLKAEIIPGTMESIDGYSTIQVRVSDPQKFLSEYPVKSITASVGQSAQKVTFDPAPVVNVDFYREVTNPQEWYDFVVKKPTENARLGKDIDFTGVTYDRIKVTSEYTGKLDGNLEGTGQDYGFTLKNINLNDSSKDIYPYVFSTVSGEINNVCIDTMNLSMCKNNRDRAGFVSVLTGNMINVHANNVNINAKNYIGALVCEMKAGSNLQDSSARNVTINYTEPANTNTNGRIGGLVGSADQCHIRNCYVSGLELNVMDIKNCEGAGGIVGYSNYGALENLYATGDMNVRGVNVGGIVGYHYAGDVSNVMRNLIARVNVTTYQDMVGGLVGMLNLGSTLTERNNMTGVAFGNVFCNNVSSENVSYTVGFMGGYRGTFYGSDFQLFNGMVNQPMDENTYGLIGYDEAMNAETYTSKLGMDGVYDYSNYVSQGYLPHLYYSDSNKELPFQINEDISVSKVSKNEVNVKKVSIEEGEVRQIKLQLVGPDGCEATKVHIEVLKYNKDAFILNERIENGNDAEVVFNYYQDQGEDGQYLDSYMLTRIDYDKYDENGEKIGIGYSDFSADPVRIPLTLFKDIHDKKTWNDNINSTNNYGNYNNFRVVGNVDFGTIGDYTTNAKIGRLVGGPCPTTDKNPNGKWKLMNMTLNKAKENLIFRLNSELSNLDIVNIKMDTKDRDCAGFIGTSAGEIYNINFENIEINNNSKHSFVGIIGYQIAGCVGKEDDPANNLLGKVSLKNIKINSGQCTPYTYTGAICGYAKTGTKFRNIEADNVSVYGDGRVGGLAGTTGKVSFADIQASNFTVISKSAERVGGIVGSFEPGRVNNKTAGFFTNVHLTGTPTAYDESGKYVESSTTTVGFSSNADAKGGTSKYCGGLIGYSTVYLLGRRYVGDTLDNSALQGNSAEGIVVNGVADYVGGLYGWCYDTRNGTIKNSLVQIIKTDDVVYNNVGGIVGEVTYDSLYNLTDTVKINSKNHNRVGLSAGYKSSGNNTYQYNYVENSELNADTTSSSSLPINYIGGNVGFTYGASQYLTTVNTTINAPNANYVGGVVGRLNHNLYSSFYYATPVSSNSPVASSEYVVEGNANVGGVVGYHDTGNLRSCYSNANVIANNYAGGLDGLYRNNFTVTKISGKDNFAYSAVYMTYNYFAGTVTAKQDYAGGLIGNLGMISQVSAESYPTAVASGGRYTAAANTTATVSGMMKTGSSSEVSYTIRNMCLADSITSAGSNAYAFAGNKDGFEGKANRYKTTVTQYGQDKSYYDRADVTFFWDCTKLIKNSSGETQVDQKLGTITGKAGYNTLGNNNDLRYVPYQTFNIDDENSKGKYGYREYNVREQINVRTVTSIDLSKRYPYDTVFYASVSDTDVDLLWFGGNYHVILTDDVTRVNTPYSTSFFSGGLLPHSRVINDKNKNKMKDNLTVYQVEKGIKLPIPTEVSTTSFSLAYYGPIYVAPAIYTSDVDKINIEFSDDWVQYSDNQTDCPFFAVYYGDELVDYHLIDKNVYTYTYDYKRPISIELGMASLNEYSNADHSAGLDWYKDGYYSIFSIEGHGIDGSRACPDNIKRGVELARGVMTYGDRYYYIGHDGVVTGTGRGSYAGGDLPDDGSDPTATTIAGTFINLYNGYGLTKSGAVINLDSKSTERTVSKMEYANSSLPLEHFILNGTEVKTYWNITDNGTYNDSLRAIMTRPQGASGAVIALLDSCDDSIKDSIVLFEKDSNKHCILLSSEGEMREIYFDDLCAPEDFHSDEIVYMSNNFKTEAPFVVVQYANGGVVGYNFLTGEYLFNHYVNKTYAPLDYLKEVYLGEFVKPKKSMYASVQKVVDANPTARALGAMVKNSVSNEFVEDNNKDINSENEYDGEIGQTGFDVLKATDDTALRDVDKNTGISNLSSTTNDTDTKNGLDQSLNLKTDNAPIVGTPNGNKQTGGNSLGDGTLGSVSELEEGDVTPENKGDYTKKDADGNLSQGSGKSIGESDANGFEGGNGSNPDDVNGPGSDVSGTNPISGDAFGKGTNTGDNVSELPDPTFDDVEALEEEAVEEIKKDKPVVGNGERIDTESERQTLSLDGEKVSGTGEGDSIDSQITVPGTTKKYEDQTESKETTEDSEEEEKLDSVTTENLMVVYNASTGTYEIIDMNKFMSDPDYVSENARLGVTDFSAYGGYATETKNDTEKEQKRGIALYILAVLAILGGVGGGIYYKKKNNLKV